MMSKRDKVRVRQNEKAGYGLCLQEAHSLSVERLTDTAYSLQRIHQSVENSVLSTKPDIASRLPEDKLCGWDSP